MDSARAHQFSFVPSPDAPLIIERTDDVWLIRDDGRRILDAGGGAIVTNVGHGRQSVAQVAAQALGTIDYVVPLWATEHRVALIEELTEHWLPAGFTQAQFLCGGSESVDAAVRLARMHQVCSGRPERWKIIGRNVSYHGSTLSALGVGLHDRRRAGLEPMLTDHPKSDWLDAESFAKVVEREDPNTIAAFIGEPINGASAAAMVPPDDYWQAIAQVCAEHDIVLIVDEVMTGFGRTGRTWGYEHFGIEPDVIVGGKGLSGGYAPMGGVYTTRAMVDPIAAAGKGLMYYTFSGADMGCAISAEVLRIMRTEGLVQSAATMGKRLRSRLEDELADHPHVADIRGLGLLQGIELVRDKNSGEPFQAAQEVASLVAMEAIERGVWVYPCGSGPVVDGILLGPPFTITDEHIDLIVNVLRDSLNTVVARLD